jgi:hypothetical protein
MRPETIALLRHLVRLAKGMLTACERYLNEYAGKAESGGTASRDR